MACTLDASRIKGYCSCCTLVFFFFLHDIRTSMEQLNDQTATGERPVEVPYAFADRRMC